MAYEFTCEANDFMVRSENDDELIEMVQQHAQERHDSNMAPDEIRSKWQSVESAGD